MTKVEEIKGHFKGYDKDQRKMLSGADLVFHLIREGYNFKDIIEAIVELDEDNWDKEYE